MDTEPRPESNVPSTLSIKRKADEAFDALDDALRTSESRPHPPKRTNTSFYSTLTKYGIFTDKPRPKFPSKPTLTALLSRTRKNKEPTISPHVPDDSSKMVPDYSPGSTDVFLKRLATYHHSTYSSKPRQIDAVAAAKAGWVNEGGKERLYCSICRVGWVLADRDGMSKEAATSLVDKQAEQLISMHKEGCPWRTRQCDPLVYRVPLQSPANLARQIKVTATEINSVVDGINIRHPLTSNQVQSFTQTVLSVAAPSNAPQSTVDTASTPPSTAALLTALFGWSLVPAPPPVERKSSAASLAFSRVQSRVVSREGTPGPSLHSSALPTTPRASRVLPSAPTTPSPSRASSAMGPPSSPAIPFPHPPAQKDTMLQCKMCLRRLGIWAFLPSENQAPSDARPQRQLDILREHRPTCPYVAKSTPLAILPAPSTTSTSTSTPRTSFNLTRSSTLEEAASSSISTTKEGLRRTASFLSGLRPGTSTSSHARSGSMPTSLQDMNLVEGWRAVYSTVMRYGMAERAGRFSAESTRTGAQPIVETVEDELAGRDNDDAMHGVIELVQDVKQHGGRQLLSYVRNLLG
ncbi:hypothetical protein M422DRAFT_64965 [Sphaerobolus stellatus SS14]|nr:hypothetical protein M422DRAFT_64965 [Sphaerobolus stellatus SS14]